MSEYPVYTATETPVDDPNLFLLNDANRTFVDRRNEFITLEHAPANRTLSMMLALGVVGMVAAIALLAVSKLPAQYNSLAFLVIAGGGVGVFLALLRYLYRDVPVKGWMIPGVVTHAEKIRVIEGRYTRENVGVRYQFVAPGGVVMDGYAEGDSETASHGMAPTPGTPVKVWLDDDGSHYLL